ncbi:MAG: hypothetical protein N3I35_14780 [Clostridia bacterium]|nr:hypothetical protein [Clostridia bacterium]
MDENLKNNNQYSNTIESPEGEQKESMQENADNYRSFTMDSKGIIRQDNIHAGRGGTAVLTQSMRRFIVLGWISAALTAFVSPLFAIAGIIFGVLINRQSKGKGNVIIITNTVLAAINIIFGFGILLLVSMSRIMTGY